MKRTFALLRLRCSTAKSTYRRSFFLTVDECRERTGVGSFRQRKMVTPSRTSCAPEASLGRQADQFLPARSSSGSWWHLRYH